MLPLEIPELDPWVARGCPLESDLFPEEFGGASSGTGRASAGNMDDAPGGSAGIPPENALKGEGIERRGEDLINTKPLSGSPDDSRLDDEADSESDEVDSSAMAGGDVAEVIAHLNAKTGKAFRTVEVNAKLIRARLAEGATVDQVKAVVDAKVAEWRDDHEMVKYLRPSTLFNATRFEQYLGQLGGLASTGRSETDAGSPGAWWVTAGFASEWEARNDYCVPGNAHLWRDRRPMRKLPGVYVEPWPEGGV
ncbi:conserved phage C-terminal domain-containing protein [Pandoraea sp. NPDC090278]|uniref:conserved phage C-terminal domain-containing protein n=1 Tax=Pandoraea sp. NPDC090278 TaxID=3364391 RepID=UPI00383A94B0